MDRIQTSRIVEAGGGRTLVNVDLTMGPYTHAHIKTAETKVSSCSLITRFPPTFNPNVVNPVITGHQQFPPLKYLMCSGVQLPC